MDEVDVSNGEAFEVYFIAHIVEECSKFTPAKIFKSVDDSMGMSCFLNRFATLAI